MKWTKEDVEYLRQFRNTTDSDDIKVKEIIKKELATNRYIAHVLHNEELEKNDAEPEEYFGINILPYYMITPTQHNLQNFLCYEVSYNELERGNSNVKYLQIIFYVLCHEKDLIDKDTSTARHDLLSALILDQFNWSTSFGKRIKCVSNKPSVTDDVYQVRTLIFQQEVDNNVVKTKNGITQIINKA